MKIIFMGTPEFSVPVLEKLIENNYEIVMVVTQPDKLQGRKKEIIYSPVKKLALEKDLKIFQPIKLKDELDEILNVDADLIVTAAFGQILPKKLLERFKAINVHGSLLPKYRGGAPIQYALFDGLQKTGVTIMDMAFKMDSGDIILQGEVPITEDDNYETLARKMSVLGADLLIKVLKGNYESIKQNEEDVTFAYNIKRHEEFLDFYGGYFNVLNHLRGLLPEPAATIVVNGEFYKVYKMVKSDIIKEMKPGEILIENRRMFIKSTTEIVEVIEIQAQGKKKMLVKDFLNGQKSLKSGDYVERRNSNV
ncbi:methionyl-tRNA formyltransferase [Haploplasma axanthum]|uniref:Methionyl-tRNA formyltransferase n=1 Tax=Haploplasma axanthum TaxID=29552 RepID=A0A449BDK9_HAPAX|nr:methionyl-tRNA formyltransferase [Haploplasma axanthum]VEU80507.1 Methionyl-tRNA formyltransferase [Haploplasma axanthum]